MTKKSEKEINTRDEGMEEDDDNDPGVRNPMGDYVDLNKWV